MTPDELTKMGVRADRAQAFAGPLHAAMHPLPSVLFQIRLFASAGLESIWVGNRFLNRDSRCDTSKCCRQADAKISASSLHRRKSNPIHDNWNHPSAVFRTLLMDSCPAAILSRVVVVWIDAVNRVIPIRSLPHIKKKILEGIFPTVANLNSSTSPIWKIFRPRVVATSLYSKPRFVLNSATGAFLVTVFRNRDGAFFNKFFVRPHTSRPLLGCAPARRSASFSEVATNNNRFVAAVANTPPHSWRIHLFNYQEAAKSLSCNVNKFHGYIIRGNYAI